MAVMSKMSGVHFPTRPFLLLCAVRFIDPLTFTQIFPYINQLIAALHLVNDPANIGFYSGLVESTFAFFQLCSIYQWARLSDAVGRRPVILIGIYGLALATLLLGFASSLQLILLSRALAGLFSGIAAVLHSVLGELTTPPTEAFAFSTYGLFWPLGAIIGPIIGGALADPATAYPSLRIFQYAFFRDYPYFLPCFATGLFALTIGVLCSFFLPETLPGRAHAADSYTQPQTPGPPADADARPLTLLQLLAIPALRALALSGAVLCFTATAFDAIFVLFCYTPIHRGGLSFTAQQIATCLALAGTSSILLQVLVLPPLLRHVSHARLYIACMLIWPLTYAAVPLLNVIVRRAARKSVSMRSYAYAQEQIFSEFANGQTVLDGTWSETDALSTFALWTAIALVMVMSRIGCLAYSISLVLVKQAAPSPAALGKANGVVLWAMCLARAGAPAAGSALFTLATAAMGEHGRRGSLLWVGVMALIGLGGAGVACRIPSAVGEGAGGECTGGSEEEDGREGEGGEVGANAGLRVGTHATGDEEDSAGGGASPGEGTAATTSTSTATATAISTRTLTCTGAETGALRRDARASELSQGTAQPHSAGLLEGGDLGAEVYLVEGGGGSLVSEVGGVGHAETRTGGDESVGREDGRGTGAGAQEAEGGGESVSAMG